VLHWFGFLFSCEDCPSVEQAAVRESPVTSHQSLWSQLAARALPYAVNAIAICRPLVGEVGTESEAGSIELLPVREVR
jgi:hypothetical protein